MDFRDVALVSQEVSKIVQLVSLFHSGQFHSLLVEGSEGDGIDRPGQPSFDGCPQTTQNILAGFCADFSQQVILSGPRIMQELRMNIERPRYANATLVQARITDHQDLSLSRSTAQGCREAATVAVRQRSRSGYPGSRNNSYPFNPKGVAISPTCTVHQNRFGAFAAAYGIHFES